MKSQHNRIEDQTWGLPPVVAHGNPEEETIRLIEECVSRVYRRLGQESARLLDALSAQSSAMSSAKNNKQKNGQHCPTRCGGVNLIQCGRF